MYPVPSVLQAVEAAQLAEDLKVQLEHTQAKLKEIQVSVAENRTARERESGNLKRAQVTLGVFIGHREALIKSCRLRLHMKWKETPSNCQTKACGQHMSVI